MALYVKVASSVTWEAVNHYWLFFLFLLQTSGIYLIKCLLALSEVQKSKLGCRGSILLSILSNVCTHAHTHTHTPTHTPTHTHSHTRQHTHLHTPTHLPTHTNTPTYTRQHTHIRTSHTPLTSSVPPLLCASVNKYDACSDMSGRRS